MSETSLPDSFKAALHALVRWLEAEQTPYAAIGGVAVSLIAHPRATQDIDAVVWLDESHWASFILAGEDYGFGARISEPLEFAARSHVLLLQHRESGISVDLSCGALPFEREMIERAVTLQVGETKLKVPTVEDLIITKAVAQRAKDLIDIEALLNVEKKPDLARIRYWVREFAGVLEMPEMLENIESLIQRSHATGNHAI
ncbi:MAG TPA: nucleotidyl transferase AbiEii/AbiGii toxin family protein [Pyrinomonadaceae bacterium]|jgi:hypothetical protein